MVSWPGCGSFCSSNDQSYKWYKLKWYKLSCPARGHVLCGERRHWVTPPGQALKEWQAPSTTCPGVCQQWLRTGCEHSDLDFLPLRHFFKSNTPFLPKAACAGSLPPWDRPRDKAPALPHTLVTAQNLPGNRVLNQNCIAFKKCKSGSVLGKLFFHSETTFCLKFYFFI